MKHQHYILPLAMVFAIASPMAQAQSWFLLGHEGCISLSELALHENLAKLASPEDYAEAMRRKGHQVSVGSMAGSPPGSSDWIAVVKIDDRKTLMFGREEICKGAFGMAH